MAVTVTLEGEALALVKYLAAQRARTVGELVADAISHERWLASEHRSGSRIYSVDSAGRRTGELVMPQ